MSSISPVDASTVFALDVIYGDMFRWNGREWAAEGVGSDSRYAIWAESAQSIWAVGSGQEHWDGQDWVPVASEDLSYHGAMAGLDGSHIFAAGEKGSLISFDGTSWTNIDTQSFGDLYAVWASGPKDVWTAGEQGLFRWDGTTVVPVDSGTQHVLSAIAGTAPDDVWVGGELGTLVHWDGNAWSYETTPAAKDINALWAPRRGEVWIADTEGSIVRYVR